MDDVEMTDRLRTGFTCSKEQRQRWRYYEGDTTCECGMATENTEHMMQYTLLTHGMTSTSSTIQQRNVWKDGKH